jgi:MarC family membrane protein
VRQSKAEADELESGDPSGVVPLAVPLLAGPGAISASILAGQAGGAAHVAAVVGCIAVVCALLWLVLTLAERIGSRLGRTGLNIATRLLGLALAAIAVEMMTAGLKELLPGLAA